MGLAPLRESMADNAADTGEAPIKAGQRKTKGPPPMLMAGLLLAAIILLVTAGRKPGYAEAFDGIALALETGDETATDGIRSAVELSEEYSGGYGLEEARKAFMAETGDIREVSWETGPSYGYDGGGLLALKRQFLLFGADPETVDGVDEAKAFLVSFTATGDGGTATHTAQLFMLRENGEWKAFYNAAF